MTMAFATPVPSATESFPVFLYQYCCGPRLFLWPVAALTWGWESVAGQGRAVGRSGRGDGRAGAVSISWPRAHGHVPVLEHFGCCCLLVSYVCLFAPFCLLL
jgi:hypothetical protein